MNSEWSAVIKTAVSIPSILEKVYGDLVQPGCQQVGKALSTVLGLGNTVLLPVHLANERSKIIVERNLDKFRRTLAETPTDKVHEVPAEIGVPILEKLMYVQDDDISSLFVNLLSSAAIEENAWSAHPSFIKIIERLCPDEAVLLNSFAVEDTDFPAVRAVLEYTEEAKGWELVSRIMTKWEKQLNLKYPKNVSCYIDNLVSCGIFNVNFENTLVESKLYEDLEKLFEEEFKTNFPDNPDYKREFYRGTITVTDQGVMFLNAIRGQKVGQRFAFNL